MLKKQLIRFSKGDTIVEVLFAVTIFSLIAVASISVMNQGVATAQRSLEITLVREQMDSQADAVRYLNKLYIADYGKNGQATKDWTDIIQANAINSTQVQAFDEISKDNVCNLPANRPFTLDTRQLGDATKAVMIPTANPTTYSKVRYDSSTPKAEGIWMQAVRSTNAGSNEPGFYDFHIRACWSSPGQQQPMTLGTIVRVYEPRG